MTTSQRTSVCPRSLLERTAPCRPPTFSGDPLPRPEVLDLLDTLGPGFDVRVALVCAPAGAGKTVLLLDWIARRLRARTPEARVAWLTITDVIDRDLSRWPLIAESLCEALGVAAPPPGSTTPVSCAAHLVDALAENSEPAVLVIDDAHLITDSFLLVAVEYLIRHAPPTLTMLLAGRYDPPLRWHTLGLEGALARIGKWELALPRSLAAQLFARYGCTLTEPELDTVMELTQGWTALVRIAAIAVAGGARDRAAALAVLARPTQPVVDFLLAEVLRPLSAPIIEFLMRTSIPDRFTEALADDLAGERAHDTLDELQRTGFPLMRRTDGGELWFTYHPMLRAYLFGEIAKRDPDTVSRLHLRTARHLTGVGRPVAALPHLLALPDQRELREFLRDNGVGLIFDGHGPQLLDAADRAGSAISDDPFLWRLRALDALTRGANHEALAYLELLRAQPRSIPSPAPRAWLDALEFALTADAVLATGSFADKLAAPEKVSATGNLDIDCYLTIQTATAMLLNGRIERGEALLRSGITLAERTGRQRLVLRALSRLATASAYAGAITVTRTRSDRALEYANTHHLRDTPDAEFTVITAAFARHLQGDSFAAQPIRAILTRLSESERNGIPAAGPALQVACWFLLSRSAVNPQEPVQHLYSGMSRLLALDPHPAASAGLLLAITVDSLLRRNETHRARDLVDRARAALGETPETVLARAMIADSAQQPNVARKLLESLVQSAHSAVHPVTAVSAWLRYAAVLHRLGMPSKTSAALESALRMSEPDGLVSPWLDLPGGIELLDLYSSRFGRLDSFAERLRRHPAAHREAARPTLTESEMIVLKHLPSTRTAGQIAADLGVSINTVKTHLRGIYSKLSANTRADAVEAARLVGLL